MPAASHVFGFVRSGRDIAEITGFGRPFGLGIDSLGRLHVTDMDLHAVFRFAVDLSTVSRLDGPAGWSEPLPVASSAVPPGGKRSPGHFDGPHAVAFGQYDNAYVTTYYTPSIRVHDAEGRHLRDIGAAGARHALSGPATATVDDSGRLLVAEYRQNAVLVFDTSGNRVAALDPGASAGPRPFDRPHMARQAPDGYIVVADTWNHRLQRFAPDGSWAGCLGEGTAGGWRLDGSPARATADPFGFHAPVAVDFDAGLGLMLVTDWGNDRLVLRELSGEIVGTLGESLLSRPYDARFFAGGIAIADSHHGRVLLLPLST